MFKKYEEKEEARAIRSQQREEERSQREFEKARKEAEIEEKRYQKALEQAQKELGLFQYIVSYQLPLIIVHWQFSKANHIPM